MSAGPVLRPAALAALALAVLSGPAAAFEFSGAYAGVNAGYATSLSPHDRPAVPRPPAPAAVAPGIAAGAAELDLPPSAAAAAARLRRPGASLR